MTRTVPNFRPEPIPFGESLTHKSSRVNLWRDFFDNAVVVKWRE